MNSGMQYRFPKFGSYRYLLLRFSLTLNPVVEIKCNQGWIALLSIAQ